MKNKNYLQSKLNDLTNQRDHFMKLRDQCVDAFSGDSAHYRVDRTFQIQRIFDDQICEFDNRIFEIRSEMGEAV